MTVESSPRSRSKARGDPLDHRRPRVHLARRASALITPLMISRCLGAGRGDVEEPQLLLGLARLRLLPEVVVASRGRSPARRGAAAAARPGGSSASRPISERRLPRSGAGAAPAAGIATTPNSSPLALWMVMIRTPSWPSIAVAAAASTSAAARAARNSRRPRRSRPSVASYSAASRISLRTLAKRASPEGRIRTARSYPVAVTATSISSASGRNGGPSSGAPLRVAAKRRAVRGRPPSMSIEDLGVRGAPPLGPRRGARSPARSGDARPAAARSSQSVSGSTPQAGEASAPNRACHRAGWRSSPAGRRRRRPAAGTSSRGHRRRRAAVPRARASPRRRRGG